MAADLIPEEYRCLKTGVIKTRMIERPIRLAIEVMTKEDNVAIRKRLSRKGSQPAAVRRLDNGRFNDSY